MEVIYTSRHNRTELRRKGENGVIGYCDHCGFAIYSAHDAVVVDATDEMIHKDCWEEYSDEHMFDFVVEVSETDDYSDT